MEPFDLLPEPLFDAVAAQLWDASAYEAWVSAARCVEFDVSVEFYAWAEFGALASLCPLL